MTLRLARFARHIKYQTRKLKVEVCSVCQNMKHIDRHALYIEVNN